MNLQGAPDQTLNALLSGRQAYQQNQLGKQALIQGQQNIDAGEREKALQKVTVMKRLAEKARSLPAEQRSGFVQSINPEMLKSVGIDPADLPKQPLDDQSLDNLIAQASAYMPSSSNQYRKESVSTTQGLKVFDPSTGTYTDSVGADGKPLAAPQYDPTLQGQIAGAKQGAQNASDLGYKPEITRRQAQAEADVEVNTKPNIEAKTTAARTEAEITSKKEAEGKANLPALEDTTANLERYVDELKTHPGRKFATGGYSMLPAIPGSPQADFKSRLGQIEGGTFLQQYSSLKGGGAITDVEGKKAEAAANRISAATSDAEFDKAVDDFKTILGQTLSRAKKQASSGGSGKGSMTPGINSEAKTVHWDDLP
jgi:hypothetical protein